MARNFLLLILFVLALSTSGCRTGGSQFSPGLVPQLGSQGILGSQQPIFGGAIQQPAANVPTSQRAQQSLGQIGQNLGTRVSDGLINQGINRAVNGVFGF